MFISSLFKTSSCRFSRCNLMRLKVFCNQERNGQSIVVISLTSQGISLAWIGSRPSDRWRCPVYLCRPSERHINIDSSKQYVLNYGWKVSSLQDELKRWFTLAVIRSKRFPSFPLSRHSFSIVRASRQQKHPNSCLYHFRILLSPRRLSISARAVETANIRTSS